MGIGGAALGGLLTACGLGSATTSSPTSSKRIGWSQSHRTVAIWNNVAIPAFDKEVRAKGHQPIVLDAQNSDAQELANVQDLITRGVASMVILPVHGPEAVPIIQSAVRQKIGVVVFNTAVPSSDYQAFVSRDNVQVAEMIAKQALKDTGLKGNWVIANGDASNSVSLAVKTGYHNVIDPYIKSGVMNLVSEEFNAGFSPVTCRAQIENALTKTNNNLTGILGAADETMVGATAALKAHGLEGKVWMGSQNGIESTCRAILLGTYNLSIFTRYDLGAKLAADLAIKLANGEKVSSDTKYDTGHGEVPYEKVPLIAITKDTLVDFLTQYSPGYVNAQNIFSGVPESMWPKGARELLAKQPAPKASAT